MKKLLLCAFSCLLCSASSSAAEWVSADCMVTAIHVSAGTSQEMAMNVPRENAPAFTFRFMGNSIAKTVPLSSETVESWQIIRTQRLGKKGEIADVLYVQPANGVKGFIITAPEPQEDGQSAGGAIQEIQEGKKVVSWQCVYDQN